MEFKRSKYKYIYNLEQANFFINKGATFIKTAINPKTNKAFVQLLNDDKLQQLYDIWMNRKRN